MGGRWGPAERAAIRQRTKYSVVGLLETVRCRLEELLEETGADEVIATAQICNHAARLNSFEIGAQVLVRSILLRTLLSGGVAAPAQIKRAIATLAGDSLLDANELASHDFPSPRSRLPRRLRPRLQSA